MAAFLLLSDTHFGYSQKTRRIWEKYWETTIATSPEFEHLDALILAGDVMSHETRQLRSALRFFRKKMGNLPIYWVRGNHDYWDSSLRSLAYQIEKTDNLAMENDIEGLNGRAILIPDKIHDITTLLTGWDCWYTAHPGNYTQCLTRIPEGGWGAHQQLSRRSLTGFLDMLAHIELYKKTVPNLRVVTVTHMPGGYTERHIGQSESQWNTAIDLSHVLVYGHTHRRDSRVVRGTTVLNAGSDYDRPNHLFFETGPEEKIIPPPEPVAQIILDDNF